MKKNHPDMDFIMTFPEPLASVPITIYYIPNCMPCKKLFDLLTSMKRKGRGEVKLLNKKNIDNQFLNSGPIFSAFDATAIGRLLEKKEELNKTSTIKRGKELVLDEIKKHLTKEELKNFAGTFPVIFVGNGKKIKYVGGYIDFEKLINIRSR